MTGCVLPIAAPNWLSMCQGPLGQNDLRIPKLLVSGSPPAPLSFDRVLSCELLRDLQHPKRFRAAGAGRRDNTADEVRALAIEMMDRLDGVAEYEPADNKLQSRFLDLVLSRRTPSTFGTMSSVGRDFLRKHVDLFCDGRE